MHKRLLRLASVFVSVLLFPSLLSASNAEECGGSKKCPLIPSVRISTPGSIRPSTNVPVTGGRRIELLLKGKPFLHVRNQSPVWIHLHIKTTMG